MLLMTISLAYHRHCCGHQPNQFAAGKVQATTLITPYEASEMDTSSLAEQGHAYARIRQAMSNLTWPAALKGSISCTKLQQAIADVFALQRTNNLCWPDR